jgi:predicted ester cyclase
MTSNSPFDDAQERAGWPLTPEQYEHIRSLWQQHSRAESERDLDGLIATLAPDCLYEVVPMGQRWSGHDGARAFYSSLFGAFPDVRFTLQHIVVGPQGVFEAATLTGTHQGVWAGIAPTGRVITLTILIYFAYNPAQGLFQGEKIFFDRGEMDELLLR